MQNALAQQASRVLFDLDSDSKKAWFPAVTVTYNISCKQSVWFCLWAELETRKRYNEASANGTTVRPIQFVEIDDNHFVSARCLSS